MVKNTVPHDYTLTDPNVRLMLRVRDGDHWAFEQLLAEFQVSVRNYLAHRLGDRERAEDLTQEVFLRVFRARRNYVARSKFSTWLFTIVNNVASNARRARSNCREFAVGGDGATNSAARRFDTLARVSSNDQPVQQMERSETREMVHHALETLNERQRTALRLCKLEGLSYSEVADAMAISPEAVKSLLNRARVNLKPVLSGYVDDGALPTRG